MKLYELKSDPNKQKNQNNEYFVEINIEILTNKADNIAIENASKSYSSSCKSQFADNLNTSLNAIKRFSEKV